MDQIEVGRWANSISMFKIELTIQRYSPVGDFIPLMDKKTTKDEMVCNNGDGIGKQKFSNKIIFLIKIY